MPHLGPYGGNSEPDRLVIPPRFSECDAHYFQSPRAERASWPHLTHDPFGRGLGLITRGRGGWLDLPRGDFHLLFFASFPGASAWGQSRHFDDVDGISALAPTATELVCGGGCRKGPHQTNARQQNRLTLA